jgi:hypothetical protein
VYDDADEEHFVSSGPVGDVEVGEQVNEIYLHPQNCGRAGAESRGAEIKLPPGAGAEIANCGSGSGSFLFIKDAKKFY